MSRSRRHSPFMGLCNGSEKQDKRIANRKLRRAVNQALSGVHVRHVLNWDEGMLMYEWAVVVEPEVLPMLREVSNPWLMAKDGMQWITDDKWMRK